MIKVPLLFRIREGGKGLSEMRRIKDITFYSLRQLPIPIKKSKKTNRARLDIIFDFLVVSRYPSSVIDLSYHVSTSYSEAKKLVTYLLSCGLLEPYPIEDICKYKTTQKGFLYIEKYKEMKKILKWKVGLRTPIPKEISLPSLQ